MNTEEISSLILQNLDAKKIIGFEDTCVQFVKGRMNILKELDEYKCIDLLHSQKGRLHTEFANALGVHLKSFTKGKKLSLTDIEKIIYEISDEADDLCFNIEYAFGTQNIKKSTANWDHSDVRKFGFLTYFEEPELLNAYFETNYARILTKPLSSATSAYLASPFRSRYVDRLLVTGLADAEIGLYTEQQVNGSRLDESPFKTALKVRDLYDGSHLWSIPKGLIKYILYSVGIYLVWGYFNIPFEFAPHIIAIFFFIIWSVSSVTLIKLRRKWAESSDLPQKVLIQLIHAFNDFYRLLHDSGDISIKVVRADLESLKNIGAIMPPTIWVILEDLEKRGQSKLSWV